MKYLNRKIDSDLQQWSGEKKRKPLMLRGARQVGKTFAVRNLGQQFKYFVEINFENKDHSAAKMVFSKHSDPRFICSELAVLFGIPIVPGETLLFLDEVQNCPDAIASLRFFYEQFPTLHIIAAGSLLEFALEEIPSFGVGRIDSMFMYPFSFSEFLYAKGHGIWVKLIQEATPEKPISDLLHEKIVEQLKNFLVIGGMPEVVAEFVETNDFLTCQKVLHSLLVSFRNDFAKYKKRIPASRINEVFSSVSLQAEGKFMYERVSQNLNNDQVKKSLELLLMAGLCYQVTHSSADGAPLGARINPKYRRIIPFDTGIYQRILHLDISGILLSSDFDAINKGAVAEIFVGCELKKNASCYDDEELYCWVREKKNTHAQIDFVVQRGETIVPIEVKSGKQGKMQSMWFFIEEKNSTYGIRTSLENFCTYGKIHVYPLYAVGNICSKQK
ncbi:MAG: AAA family ATPase [Prevotellaceae bacterium]|jgi:predicted AAA+ superfamily ATPase|nr:AAA family ATPase [Prevotellaceae bacterium]